MLQNLAVGTVLVVLTVLIHTVGLISIAALTPRAARWLRLHSHDFGRTLVMTGTVVGLLAVLTLEVWSWAVAYHLLGVTHSLEDALSLSTDVFSTIGYGDLA